MRALRNFPHLGSHFALEGIRKVCPLPLLPLEHILGLGFLGNFGLKNQTRKIDQIHKDFELCQVFVCQTVLIFPNIYIIHKKN